MKLLLTGGAGFIGSHTADYAIKMGLDVVIIDRLCSGREERTDPRCKVYQMDVSGKELRAIFEQEQPDYCIHLAEQTDVDESLLHRGSNPNLRSLIHLLDLCKEFPVQKLVYASSADVYGATELLPVNEASRCFPLSFNGRAKLSAEEYIKQYGALYGLDYTILRYTNVYGLRQTAGSSRTIADLLEAYMAGGRPVVYGKGLQLRDFVYVTDVASANMLALSRGSGETYNIGSGRAIRMLDVIETVNELLGLTTLPLFRPARTEDLMHLCVSCTKAEETLGWTPRIKLKEGLTQALGDSIYRRFMDKLIGSPGSLEDRRQAHMNHSAS